MTASLVRLFTLRSGDTLFSDARGGGPVRARRFTGVALRTVIVSLTLSIFTMTQATADPISWMEGFALAVDREAKLAELIPGSDDYYFYHCLHFQTTGQLERSETMIRDWLAEHKGRETASISAMIDRQRLLTYRDSPQRTIDHLVRRLGIKLDHAPPPTQNERRFPSALDPALLAPQRIVDEALRRNDVLKPMGIQYLAERFRAGDSAGIPIGLGDLMQNVRGPYLDGLDELVIKELSNRRPNEQRFGDFPSHALLTLNQLRAVARQLPQVAGDDAFVAAILARLRPSADVDMVRDQRERIEYLKRVDAYVQTLPPSYSSLKASAAYRLLQANLHFGNYDRDLFLRYLQLPRVSAIVPVEWANRGGPRANLNEDFMGLAMLPAIGDEEPLVRTYLEHFLKDAASLEQFASFLRPEYLRRMFAETKLLYGVGDPDQWYRMLSAEERQSIHDRTELRLAAENLQWFSESDPTRLIVDLKNVQELVVRIYELNTASYYRTHDEPIDTDIDLDGLVPTHEKTFAYHQPATQRHREPLELAEVSGRGVWVVDLVGKGLRARALVRRGAIDHVDSFSADGMVFTIVDENREPIPTATMWVGSREFVADDQGRIVLPPVVDEVTRRGVVSDGRIADQILFAHLREQYRLEAGMHIDRTLLQSGGESEILIRPRLLMGQTPIDPATLQEVSVRIEATDLDGLPITHQVDKLKLDQNAELVVPIRIPARLANLRVIVSGTIAGLADGQEQTLQTERAWDVGGVRRTSQVHDAMLTRDGAEFVIEVRGRNGEAVPRATVALSLSNEYCNGPTDVTLQADDLGHVRLGSLVGVTAIRFSVASGLQHIHDLVLNRVRWPNEVHTTTNQPLRLPLADPQVEVGSRFRLLEVREGRYVGDHGGQLAAKDGLLSIDVLPGGDYHLLDRSTGEVTLIAVVEGMPLDRMAVGKARHQSIAAAVPLSIASIDWDDEGVRIRLSGITDTARVHVYASRYLDSSIPMDELSLPFPQLWGRRVGLVPSGYVSDLRLGDEYQYVLNRRYAKKFPGVMLPQPGIILNPWETEETTNASQSMEAGDAPMASAPPSAEGMYERELAEAATVAAAGASDFDFLADAGVILTNLRPDKDGVITLPPDAVEGLPLLQIVACDTATVVQRTIASALGDVQVSDLRLRQALDASKSLTLERAVSIASPDHPLSLKSLGSAQLQIYASVADLFKLYKTMVDDPRLSDFDVLAVWNTLDEKAKLDAYTRLACHELHVFLWFHDRSFFQEVIAPYLANKKEKQFIDHWLLESDLTPYTQLWQYNQLNAAERSLLAMRMPELRANVLREFREVIEIRVPDQELIRKGIEIALRGRNFGLDDGLERGAVELYDMQLPELADSDGAAWSVSEKAATRLGRSRAKLEVESLGAELLKQRSESQMDFLSMGRAGRLGMGEAFFREMDSTKQWAESQWDRIRTVGGPSPESLIAINQFWQQVAGWDPTAMQISTHLLSPTENRHAALFALALSGLPLSPGDVGLPTDREQDYRPAHGVAVVTKRLRELGPSTEESAVLIGQRFEALDATLNVSARNRRKATANSEPNEFLVGSAYRGQVVVSNPTAQQRIVEIFWQVPAGSLPLAGQQMTDSRTVTLEPFAVQTIEYPFYFPAAGEFTHYPATVAADGQLIAKAAEKSFVVVAQPTESGEVSWEMIADTGTAEQIEAFLREANLREIDWTRVAHRMKDESVYRVVTAVLQQARLPITELWGYGFAHRDEAVMRVSLGLRDDLVQRVGPALKSPLLEVDPIERRLHELLEYAPLVRARIHRLGQHDEILNPTFRAQYESFVRVLGFQDQFSPEDRLVLTYYLLIQNRIAEAIDQFGQVDRAGVSTQLQYDYLDAYLALQRGQYDRAERIAASHREHPVPRWQTRFEQLWTQLRQRQSLNETEQLVSTDDPDSSQAIDEGSGDLAVMDRERRQGDAAEGQPEVIVRVEGDSLRIDHRNAKEAILNFYGVDLELLFSKAPFVREDLQRMAMVRPARSEQTRFDGSTGVGRVDLDENLRRQTLLVEVVAGASRSTALYFGGDLTTYVSESFGQLQTTDMTTRRPAEGVYVKVYAKYPDGSVRFYKDGYTDLRGRFDYASVSASDARGALRFAILVTSDEKGATVHDVATPNQ